MAEEEGRHEEGSGDDVEQLLKSQVQVQQPRSRSCLKAALGAVAFASLCLVLLAAFAPCSFQHARERMDVSRSWQLFEQRGPTQADRVKHAQEALGAISSDEEAARVAHHTLEEAGRRALDSFQRRMQEKRQPVLEEESHKLKAKVNATLPVDPALRGLESMAVLAKKLQLRKNTLESNLGFRLKKDRQNVLVRCLIDVMATVQNVAVLGVTIKGEIDTCKATGSSPMMTRLDMLEPGGKAIDGWEETDKAKLACFLNSNGIVFVLSNLATAVGFAAGDCAYTIELPDAAFQPVYTHNNSVYFDRLCAANIASTVNVVSQFASAGAMAGTSCPNADSPVSAPASTFGTGANDEFVDGYTDDYDAGGIRRLSAEQRKLLGAAGGGQPTLGTGQTGNALACLLDAEGVLFSIMQIGVELDYAFRLNCKTGEYANGPTTKAQVIANKLTKVSPALCSANVGGVIQGFINIITVGQIMVMHCDNIMTASRMCGQGISMFFSAAANLVRGTGQLYDFCVLKAFNSAQVDERWQWKKGLVTRRLQEDELRRADPVEFFEGLYKNVSGYKMDLKKGIRGDKEWRKLLQLADAGIEEAQRIKAEKEPPAATGCSAI